MAPEADPAFGCPNANLGAPDCSLGLLDAGSMLPNVGAWLRLGKMIQTLGLRNSGYLARLCLPQLVLAFGTTRWLFDSDVVGIPTPSPQKNGLEHTQKQPDRDAPHHRRLAMQ